jgi:hypothetical protein
MSNGHGGARKGGGRPPKADEIKLIERLTPMDDDAFKALSKGVKDGDLRFVKLYMEYRWGKPKETKDITSNGESLNFGQISFFDTEEK